MPDMTNKTSEIIDKTKKAICKALKKEFSSTGNEEDRKYFSPCSRLVKNPNHFYIELYEHFVKNIEDITYYVKNTFEITYFDYRKNLDYPDIREKILSAICFTDLELDDGRILHACDVDSGVIGVTFHFFVSYEYVARVGAVFS